jgi:hypothetical protein
MLGSIALSSLSELTQTRYPEPDCLTHVNPTCVRLPPAVSATHRWKMAHFRVKCILEAAVAGMSAVSQLTRTLGAAAYKGVDGDFCKSDKCFAAGALKITEDM